LVDAAAATVAVGMEIDEGLANAVAAASSSISTPASRPSPVVAALRSTLSAAPAPPAAPRVSAAVAAVTIAAAQVALPPASKKVAPATPRRGA